MACASQGTGGDDEARLKDILSNFDSKFIGFDRAKKVAGFLSCMRVMREGGFDLFVFEGTGFAVGLSAILGYLLFDRHYVFSSGDAVAPYLTSRFPFFAAFFLLYEFMLYRFCSGFIGWTPYLSGRALTFGVKRSMSAPGWAPFPLSPQARLAARIEIRAELAIPEEAIVFGIAGTLQWSVRRQYCYGAELVRAALRSGKQTFVLIIGDGTGLQQLRKISGTALGKSIFLPGHIPRAHVPRYLAAMDIGSIPQSVDRLGSFRYTTKLAEFRASRLPFVSTQIPMAYDLDEGDILRLPGDSPWSDEFINALANLMKNATHEKLRCYFKVKEVTEKFNKEDQINRVSAFISDILIALKA